jgi:hypothetical protein
VNVQSAGGAASGVTAVTGTTPTTMASPPPTAAMTGTLAGISQQLGMSATAVQGALGQGQSISDLATQQGVSRSALVASVQAQIQQSRQANGHLPIAGAVLDRMVNRAFDHHRRAQSPGTAGAAG